MMLVWTLPATALQAGGETGIRGGSPFGVGDAARAGVETDAGPEQDPLALTDEMKAFLDSKVDPEMRRDFRLRRLQEIIFDPDEGLGVTYGVHGTYSAAETFEKASGNCLSFTLLFVSMARHLGFIVHFVEVDEVTGWSRRGEVSFNHWHMFAEVEMANGVAQVDFLPWEERRYRARRRIEEPRVKAHFYNNIGAQKLTELDSSSPTTRATVGSAATGAMAYFHKALELDPTFIPARINLAVAQRRSGLDDDAEANLRMVLRDEPRNAQAATNLANLYSAQGRAQDAERWIKKRERFQKQNPFYHFRLGLSALASGDAEQARSHLRRAIVRQADEAAFHEQMAEAHYRLGDSRKARISLERALDYAEEIHKPSIEAKLRRLDELSQGGSGVRN